MDADSKTDVAAPSVALGRRVRRFKVADPQDVPEEIAVCPECGGNLTWQVTTTDWLNDLSLDCEFEEMWDEDEKGNVGYVHRNWQSDWQPVIEAVKAWIISANGKPSNRGSENE